MNLIFDEETPRKFVSYVEKYKMRQMISGLILSARSNVSLKDPWYSNEAELLKSHNYNVNSQRSVAW